MQINDLTPDTATDAACSFDLANGDQLFVYSSGDIRLFTTSGHWSAISVDEAARLEPEVKKLKEVSHLI